MRSSNASSGGVPGKLRVLLSGARSPVAASAIPRGGYSGSRRSMPVVFMMRLAISSIEDSLVSSIGIE